MTAPSAASEAVNRAARAARPSGDGAWMRDPAAGLGRLAPSDAAMLARALDACVAGGTYVESMSAAAAALGVRRATACDARRRLVEARLLSPCGLEMRGGSPARADEATARVNNQMAYVVDQVRLLAAWEAFSAERGRTARELGELKTRPGKAGRGSAPELGMLKTQPAKRGARSGGTQKRTACELGFRLLEGGTVIKTFSSEEKKKEKKGGDMEEHMAAYRALAASWAGTSRVGMREAAAYVGLVSRGFTHDDIQRAADDFARWVAGTEEGQTHMSLLRFLTDSGQKFLASARRARLREEGRSGGGRARTAPAAPAAGRREGGKEQARGAAEEPAARAGRGAARPQAPRATGAYTAEDLTFTWAGDGSWSVRTPGGWEAALYPSWPLNLESAPAEGLRAAWVAAYGERGPWSTFRALGEAEAELSWVEEEAGQGHWVARLPGSQAVSLGQLPHGRRRDARASELVAEANEDKRTVRLVRAAGRAAA